MGQGEAAVDNQGIAALLLLLPALNLSKIHSGFMSFPVADGFGDPPPPKAPDSAEGWDFKYHPRFPVWQSQGSAVHSFCLALEGPGQRCSSSALLGGCSPENA